MIFKGQIVDAFVAALKKHYGFEENPDSVLLSQTRKEIEGDYTVVIFPYVKRLKKSPQELGDTLGAEVVNNLDFVVSYSLVKGFLNFTFSPDFWVAMTQDIAGDQNYGISPRNGEKRMVEFSSPNTNKPLHLGHIRNILLGWSCAQILDAAGYDVIKTQIINDRGIAICKSMLAWQKFGNGETPESTGIKGDHFVGKYYVIFDQKLREEYSAWQSTDEAKNVFEANKKENEEVEGFFKRYKNQYFNDYSVLGNEAKDMLLKWEAKDDATRQLWALMNGWVYDGFDATYEKLRVNFDSLYYESDTYLLGKDIVEDGLEKGIFFKKEDGSVWIDLEDVGMDQKIVLRSDGTSVYMTQDIGTAHQRYKDHGAKGMTYVVADEQDYHFKVLFEILKRMEEPYADALYHLSYGLVNLPSGRMKSREGTVVDADDLVAEVIAEAKTNAKENGEVEEMTTERQNEIYSRIGLGALKYFIIKVSPKKSMVFDPKESVDMQGQTGPYIQNAYVRIQSVLRKNEDATGQAAQYTNPNEWEIALLKELIRYPEVLADAAKSYDPALVANYCYELAKKYHRFYHEVRILAAETEEAKAYRLQLSKVVGSVIEKGMKLLGIEMPERM